MAQKLPKNKIAVLQKKLENDKESLLLQIGDLKREDPFMDPDHATDNAAIDTDVREQIGHDTIEAEIKDLLKRVKDIDHALAKIKKGDYGFCERCHMPIPEARLQLIPEAKYDIDCEKQLVR